MPGLRIAHVVSTFPPYLGGTGNVAFHNALELARLGHNVDIFTAPSGRAAGWVDPTDLRVNRLTTPFRLGNAPLTPDLIARLRGYDLVHLHWPYIFGAELTWLASHLWRQPYVLTYHIDLVSGDARGPLFAAYQAIWVPRLIRRARAVLAVSSDHFASTYAARFAADSGTPVREVLNGVDLARFSPGDRQAVRTRLGLPLDRHVALFVAALDRAHHYKGLGYLLEAIALLDDVVLVVVGDGDLRTGYEADAARRGIASRVRFVGGLRHDVLPDYYRAADVTVLPSTQTESFGLVLAESLACATPAIATALPGVRSVIEDGLTGLLVPPGQPRDLAAALERLLGDSQMRDRFGIQGRGKAERSYDWRIIARTLEAVYREALDGAA